MSDRPGRKLSQAQEFVQPKVLRRMNGLIRLISDTTRSSMLSNASTYKIARDTSVLGFEFGILMKTH